MVSYEFDVITGAEAYTFNTLMEACATEDGALAWCTQVGLIASALSCPSCAGPMRRTATRWRCSKAGCRVERILRANSLFAHSTAPLSKLLKLLFFWASGAHITEAAQHVEVTPKTAGQWYAVAHDICSAEMLRCDMQIGGDGHYT
eukprot:jgi/Phyca11/20608/fgenesh1_pg.PHYCAscaffold_67_\